MGKHHRQLGGQGNKKGFFGFIELAGVALLHNQYAQYLTTVDDRRAKKGIKNIFPDIREMFEVSMPTGVRQVYRLFPAANQPHQAFIERE